MEYWKKIDKILIKSEKKLKWWWRALMDDLDVICECIIDNTIIISRFLWKWVFSYIWRWFLISLKFSWKWFLFFLNIAIDVIDWILIKSFWCLWFVIKYLCISIWFVLRNIWIALTWSFIKSQPYLILMWKFITFLAERILHYTLYSYVWTRYWLWPQIKYYHGWIHKTYGIHIWHIILETVCYIILPPLYIIERTIWGIKHTCDYIEDRHERFVKKSNEVGERYKKKIWDWMVDWIIIPIMDFLLRLLGEDPNEPPSKDKKKDEKDKKEDNVNQK